MAPEQAWGQTRQIGPLADQYAQARTAPGIVSSGAYTAAYTQPGSGGSIGVGVGLAPGHVVFADNHVEVAAQVEMVEDIAERGAACRNSTRPGSVR